MRMQSDSRIWMPGSTRSTRALSLSQIHTGAMPRGKSKAELQAELDEANDRVEELEAKLDDIAGLASGEDDDAAEDDEDLEDEDE